VKDDPHTRTRTLLQYGSIERARGRTAEDRATGDLYLTCSEVLPAALRAAAAVGSRNEGPYGG